MSSERLPDTARLAPTGALTIYDVAQWWPSLRAALASHAHVMIDLSGVTQIDGAGAQLLLVGQALAQRAGVRVTVTGVPAALAPMFDTFAFKAHFPPSAAEGDEHAN